MESPKKHIRPERRSGEDRRDFLSLASSAVMVGGLAAGYGTLTWIAGAFLYPARPRRMAWVYVADIAGVQVGQSIDYQAPGGEKITIARRGESGSADDFLALSSTCPHLGCQVHWEPHNDRFFCPCHNGVFDPEGKATAGPPAEAGQSLPRYPLQQQDGLLFIEVPLDGLTSAHDPPPNPPPWGEGRVGEAGPASTNASTQIAAADAPQSLMPRRGTLNDESVILSGAKDLGVAQGDASLRSA